MSRKRTYKPGQNTVTIAVRSEGVDELLREIGELSKGVIRPAAQAGAQVFYDQVKQNVNSIPVKTGNLRDSIYQVYSKDKSDENTAVYHISWNRKKAPHGHLIEFGTLNKDGTERVAPRAFLRSAQSRADDAADAAIEKIHAMFDEANEKL